MAWVAHQGSYRTYSATVGKGAMIGFAEGKNDTTDLSNYCYCYRDKIIDTVFQRVIPPLWTIVKEDSPWNEIGYMSFSLDGNRFYFKQGPDNYHEGLNSENQTLSSGEYLMRTIVRDSSSGHQWPSFLISDKNGFLISRLREDGVRVGAGAWEVTDPNHLMYRSFPAEFSAEELSNWSFTLSCKPIGSYETDPTLSGLTPTLTPHFDFLYKKYGTSYTDDFPALSGEMPDGDYYQCFTDGPTVRKIGDRVYMGFKDGESQLSSALYVWQGGLLNDAGNKVFYAGCFQFPELNTNNIPYDTFALTWYDATQDYRYIGVGESYIRWHGNGNSYEMEYVYNGEQKWHAAFTYYKRGIPTNYRFNMLRYHLDDPHNEFLRGDQFTINI